MMIEFGRMHNIMDPMNIEKKLWVMHFQFLGHLWKEEIPIIPFSAMYAIVRTLGINKAREESRNEALAYVTAM